MQLNEWGEWKYVGITVATNWDQFACCGHPCFTERRESIDYFGKLGEGRWVRRASTLI